jgi:Zn-finger nucleic acid-binding protein
MGLMVPEPPLTAGKMGCPSCGAPVDPSHQVCEFCSTKLATVMCPTCFGVVFDGSKHCKHCGGRISKNKVIHHGDEVKNSCPRCEDNPHLRIEVVAGCPLERCPKCEGLWIDREVVEKIYKDKKTSGSIKNVTESKGTPLKRRQLDGKPEGYIKCPECEKIMNRQNFGRFSGVIIDVCRDHGTWFDADELMHILEFIESGGLEKAAEREKQELKEEVRRLKGQKNAGGSMSSGTSLGGGGLLVSGGVGMSGYGRLTAERTALKAIGGLLKALFR